MGALGTARFLRRSSRRPGSCCLPAPARWAARPAGGLAASPTARIPAEPGPLLNRAGGELRGSRQAGQQRSGAAGV